MPLGLLTADGYDCDVHDSPEDERRVNENQERRRNNRYLWVNTTEGLKYIIVRTISMIS